MSKREKYQKYLENSPFCTIFARCFGRRRVIKSIIAVVYPQNYEHKIGFDLVREQVSSRCLSPMGRERVEAMAFSDDSTTLARLLDETAEMVRILREEPDALPADGTCSKQSGFYRSCL